MGNFVSKTDGRKKKTVIHFIFSLTTGGAENLVIDLVNHQAATHYVYLVILNKFYEADLLNSVDKKVKKILINRKTGSRNIFKILILNYWLLKIKPDIIHCHNEEAIAIVFFNRRKTVLTVHDVKMEIKHFKHYQKLIAISKAVKDDVEVRSGYQLKAEIVYNAVDFGEIGRKKSYSIKDSIHIVQVSRLVHEKKGQDILLEALHYLKEKKKYNLQLTLVGSGKSLPFLTNLINEYQLNENVIFEEGRDRTWVHEHLADFDLLVQPSRYEGFGLTIIEGIAAKIPVIASDLDGPREILANGECGELFTIGDSLELAKKIEEIILAYQSGQVEEKTEKSYQYAFMHFSLQKMLLAYEGVYNNLN